MLKEKKCRNCGNKFTPKYNTLEIACSIQCAIVLGKEKTKKKQAKEWREEKKVIKEKLETKTEVENKLQKEINLIVRLLDKDHPCISSGLPLGKSPDAGHFWSIGSNPQIRFHLLNIFTQTVFANQHKGGQPLEYMEGLENTFGSDLKNYCLSLKGLPSLNLEKHELKEKISIARGIVKWLKLQDRKFSNKERIELRIKFNEQIGIYKS